MAWWDAWFEEVHGLVRCMVNGAWKTSIGKVVHSSFNIRVTFHYDNNVFKNKFYF